MFTKSGILLVIAGAFAAGTASATTVSVSTSYSLPGSCLYVNVVCTNDAGSVGSGGQNLFTASNTTGVRIADVGTLTADLTGVDAYTEDYTAQVQAEGNQWTLRAFAYLNVVNLNTTELVYYPSQYSYPTLQNPTARASASFDYRYIATSNGIGPLTLQAHASLSGGVESAVNSTDITSGISNLSVSYCVEDLNTFAQACSGQFKYALGAGTNGSSSSTDSIVFNSGDTIDVSMSVQASVSVSPTNPIYRCCYYYVDSPDRMSAVELADGAHTATFDGFTATDQGGNPVSVNLQGVTGSDFVPSTSAPEPSTLVLIAAGLAAAFARRFPRAGRGIR